MLSPLIRVEHSSTVGRHVVATSDLVPGMVLLSEAPLAFSEAAWITDDIFEGSSSVYGLLGNLLIATPQPCYTSMYPTADDHEFYTSLEFKDACKFKPTLRELLEKYSEDKPDLRANLEANWPLFNKLAAIIAFNSICNSTEGGLSTAVLCLYNHASCFNHSCWPNACVVINHLTHHAEIRALAVIPRGQQVCISYCELYQPKPRRIQSLQESHKFTCGCARCTRERPTDRSITEMTPGTSLTEARQAVGLSTQTMEEARDLVSEGSSGLPKAAKLLRATLTIALKTMGPNHCILVRLQLMLADVFEKMGMKALLPEAFRLHLLALQAMDAVLPFYCLEKVEVLKALIRVYTLLHGSLPQLDTTCELKNDTTSDTQSSVVSKKKGNQQEAPIVTTIEQVQARWNDLNRICFGPAALATTAASSSASDESSLLADLSFDNETEVSNGKGKATAKSGKKKKGKK